ncbi:AbrB/MazE/SpoVT family DNA-binding domain-containing protein [Paracraurococcus ruber]|nr:AbrB/MazE/SpoVT family DNA-binding domain-containing protein [Paracraurococcus ruber]
MPVTVKGQVTIPKPIRDRLGLAPGSRVEFVPQPDGRVVLQKADEGGAKPDPFAQAMGSATALKGMTTDEIMLLLRGEREDL